jgi:hypothetical protein
MRRLQAYALSRGFAIVTLTSNPKRARFACIHYGAEARNWRSLEDHVQKNDEGAVVSRRQRDDTSTNTKGCA